MQALPGDRETRLWKKLHHVIDEQLSIDLPSVSVSSNYFLDGVNWVWHFNFIPPTYDYSSSDSAYRYTCSGLQYFDFDDNFSVGDRFQLIHGAVRVVSNQQTGTPMPSHFFLPIFYEEPVNSTIVAGQRFHIHVDDYSKLGGVITKNTAYVNYLYAKPEGCANVAGGDFLDYGSSAGFFLQVVLEVPESKRWYWMMMIPVFFRNYSNENYVSVKCFFRRI